MMKTSGRPFHAVLSVTAQIAYGIAEHRDRLAQEAEPLTELAEEAVERVGSQRQEGGRDSDRRHGPRCSLRFAEEPATRIRWFRSSAGGSRRRTSSATETLVILSLILNVGQMSVPPRNQR